MMNNCDPPLMITFLLLLTSSCPALPLRTVTLPALCVAQRIYGGHYVTPNTHHVSCVPDFQVEVQLDSHKHKQKSPVKRALFLDSHQPLLQRSVRVRRGERVCNHTRIYLRVRPPCHHTYLNQ